MNVERVKLEPEDPLIVKTTPEEKARKEAELERVKLEGTVEEK